MKILQVIILVAMLVAMYYIGKHKGRKEFIKKMENLEEVLFGEDQSQS